jgi:hypothetical protein
MSVAFEGKNAEKALIDYFGGPAIYPDFELEIYRGIFPFLGEFRFADMREYDLCGSLRNGDEGPIYLTVYLDEHDNALLPPFWGSLDYTFGFAGDDDVRYFAGIELERYSYQWSPRNDCEEASAWHVWFWENKRWASVLRVEFPCDEYVRFEFNPSRDQAREIICIRQKTDSDEVMVGAKFEWHPHDKTLTLASEPAFEFALKKPKPPMTMDDPMPKTNDETEEEETEIPE